MTERISEYSDRMPPRQTVLIVEDDTDLRKFYRHVLSIAGFDVQEARGGFEALRNLDLNPPDIVVLDLMLPDVDGFVVMQELAAHAHTRSIPLVVVTGSAEDLDHLEVACLLKKPVSPEDLVNVVRKCLSSGAPRVV
ncbi:MAG: response regulator [Acidobacteria bacterium]|nr:response regulator [Acidobacteriota bacterium]